MIRLDRIELLHWDLQAHQVLPLANGVTLCTGENGSGKTSLLDAIKVALGATKLAGDRTIDGYLAKQARPLAMIRLVADNRRVAGTRRRPFDALGELDQDLVTLAVVMRQDEESHYLREYYLLDGDAVPAIVHGPERRTRTGPRAARVLGHRDYLERLKKVGIGREYLKLLGLPQGQIAKLCSRDGAVLFDELFDIIGGRETLDAWVACLRELADAQREQDSVQRELDARKRELAVLAERVRHHDDYLGLARALALQRRALPHVRLAEAQLEAGRAQKEVAQITGDIDATNRRIVAARSAAEAGHAVLERAIARIAAIKAEMKAAADEHTATYQGWARLDARLSELDKLRREAQGKPMRDLAELEREDERFRALLAQEAVAESAHAQERRRIQAELEQLARGLVAFPNEVDPFRDALRRAGIAHHLLAEVLEVSDGAWAAALEGYLGRTRFAVLVQDPTRWSEAAELARRHRYPHGVLAPDVRGRSPADDSGLGAMVEVGEARYRSLVARLLRRVIPGEPALPLEPARHEELLAADGFLVTRLEARHAATEQHYLGRGARERRTQELTRRHAELDAASDIAAAEVARLRRELSRVASEIAGEKRRLEWEAARDEHARIARDAAAAKERLATLVAREAVLASDLELAQDARLDASNAETRAITEADNAGKERTGLDAKRVKLEERRKGADAALGEQLASPPGEPDAEVHALLRERLGLDTIEAMIAENERRLDAFEPAVRDALLPVNYQRQAAEMTVSERRLATLAEREGRTREAAATAHDQYRDTTRRVFRAYFGRLQEAARSLDWAVEGQVMPRDDGRFECRLKVAVGMKSPVSHDSEELSGGQKAALSILMAMTAVALDEGGASFFLVDEPFSASDVQKINELGAFLAKTGAQYLLSMPTSADVAQCGEWLAALWLCTRSRGGLDADHRPMLAPPVKFGLAHGARA